VRQAVLSTSLSSRAEGVFSSFPPESRKRKLLLLLKRLYNGQ
jgi:hypothetical protein